MTNIELYKILKRSLADAEGTPTPMKLMFTVGDRYFNVDDVDIQYEEDVVVLIANQL